jgi:TP901 family phage tail tape measure protein
LTEKIGLIAIFDTSNFNKGLRDYVGGVKEATGATESATTGAFSWTRALEVGVGMALEKVGELAIAAASKIGSAIAGMVEDAISVESAFAGVIKTTDGLIDPLGNLTQAGSDMKQEFRDLAKEIPISLEELMKIGEIGGQLGVPKESILDFTETIAALGETTNLSTEDAAMGLSQFMNIMGTSQKDVGNLGSSIVYLGNNFATTESDILNFGRRISGAGAIVGMTEGDVLGISAAFSSMGIGAEAGGTAVQKTLLDMNTSVIEGGNQLKIYAKTAGVSASEFSEMWEKDAAGAFSMFVSGLGEQGDGAISTLKDLGLEDQRLTQAFLSMSQNGDLLTSAIDGSNAAFMENSALTAEASTRYGTTESQIQIMKNNFRDLGLTIGDALLPALNGLIGIIVPIAQQYGPQLAEVFAKVGKFVEGLVSKFAEFITKSGGLSGIWEKVKKAFSENAFIQKIIDKFSQFISDILPYIEIFVQQATNLWNSFMENIDTIWEGIQGIVLGAIDIVTGIIQTGMALFAGDWAGAWESIQQVLQGAWDFIVGVLETALGLILTIAGSNLEQLSTTISQLWTIIQIKTTEVWEAIKIFFSNVWEWLVTTVTNVGGSLMETITSIWTTVSGIFTSVWTAISAFFTGIWEGIKTVFTVALGYILALVTGDTESANEIITAVWEIIKTFLTDTWENIKTVATDTWEAVKTTISEKWEEIKTAATEKWEAIKLVIKEKTDALKILLPRLWNDIKTTVSTKWEELKTAAGEKFAEIKTTVETKIEEIKTFLGNIDLAQIGYDMIMGLGNGIKSAAGAVVDAAKSVVKNAIQAAKDALVSHSPSKVFMGIGVDTMLGMAQGISSASSIPQGAMLGAVGGMVSSVGNTTNNYNNSKNIELNIANYGQNANNNTYFDVVAGLQAVGV